MAGGCPNITVIFTTKEIKKKETLLWLLLTVFFFLQKGKNTRERERITCQKQQSSIYTGASSQASENTR